MNQLQFDYCITEDDLGGWNAFQLLKRIVLEKLYTSLFLFQNNSRVELNVYL